MYRGQDLGDKEELIQKCIHILQTGSPPELYDILPHLSILRSSAFFEPLLALLENDDRERQEFAALALGSLGDPRCIPPLVRTFMHPTTLKGGRNQSLQTAIIVALGETGHEDAVDPLLQILNLSSPQDQFRLRRKKLVLSSLGNLALQGSSRAEGELAGFLGNPDAKLRSHAVTELATAYWNRAQHIPEEILQHIFDLANEESEEVRSSAMSALSNLADLGCDKAEHYLRHHRQVS